MGTAPGAPAACFPGLRSGSSTPWLETLGHGVLFACLTIGLGYYFLRRAAKKEGSSGGTMLSRLLTKYDMRNSFEGIAEDGEQLAPSCVLLRGPAFSDTTVSGACCFLQRLHSKLRGAKSKSSGGR